MEERKIYEQKPVMEQESYIPSQRLEPLEDNKVEYERKHENHLDDREKHFELADEEIEGVERYKLKLPFTFEGEYIDEVKIDFTKLTGRDLEDAARKLTQQDATALSIELSKPYQAAIVAKACNMPLEFMWYLGAKDYTYLTISAMNFLMF